MFKSFTRKITALMTGLLGFLAASTATASTALTTTGSLYSGLVQNVLNGEIGTVVAIGLVAFGVFMMFRSAAMGVLALAGAILFWNAEAILNTILAGQVI